MPARMKGGERRAAIVAEAIRLFAEKGFRGTTTRELASALGVTEPVLYQHFKTKRDLYTAIIESKSREGVERSAGLHLHLQGDDDRAFLTELADLILDHFDEDPGFTRLLFFSALERHELAALFFERQVVRFYDVVAGYIRRRSRAGAFHGVNPQLAARSFIGMVSYHGQVHLLFAAGLKMPRKKLVDQLVTIFLDGMRLNGGAR
jgi:TetR/AcrR family transcriptional regulator